MGIYDSLLLDRLLQIYKRRVAKENMSSTSVRSALLAVALLLAMSTTSLATSLLVQESEAASGIDVRPTEFEITYTNSADQNKYRLLSSADPTGGSFNRPLSLFVIDGMVNVTSRIQITVENSGTTASGAFTLQLVVIHNEYSGFEIFNSTLNVNSIGSGGTTTTSTTWAPKYGGNHTMIATTLIANDDNKGNDALTRSLAVGQFYDNADAQGTWNFATGWQLDSAVSLSNSAFNIGTGGTSSTHGQNWDRSLTSPVLDFSNAHPNPNTYGKLGFFYTGSAGGGDGIRIEWYQPSSGNWVNTVNNGFSFDGVVDADLTDGTNWLIQNEINMPGGTSRPGFNIPPSTLSSQTQFRFRFISDASGNAQGYWLEDIVVVYDEKAWPEEFNVGMTKGADGHARRGHWAEHAISITNEGNITDFYKPSLSGLPNGWDYQFVHMSGSTILPSMTIEVEPGQTFNFQAQIKPGPGAPVGGQTATATISSTLHPSTSSNVVLNTLVDPEYIPSWDPTQGSNYCLPGSSCEFSINLSNIGDGSDTFAVTSTPVVQWANWTFDVSFNQPPTVTIAPGNTAQVLLQADIPNTALPGQTASIDVTAISQADNLVTDTIRVNLTASMISDAEVNVNPDDIPADGWWVEPSESVIIPFTVWNNATSQDTFSFQLDTTNMRGWNATLPASTTLVVRAGESGRILVTLTAPENAQSGDPAPLLTPIVTSTTSGTSALSTPYGGVRVTMLHDIILRVLGVPTNVTPGQPSSATYEIENNGNGPEHAILLVEGIPSTWEYHIEVEATELSGPISLSPSYELNHIAQVQIIFTPPGGEEANLEIEIDVSVVPSDGEDLTPSDNEHSFSVRTNRVTRPVLSMDTDVLDVRTDSMHLVTLGVLNDGNAVDGAMRIRIVADTLLPGITSTLSNGGTSIHLNQWMDLGLTPQQNKDLQWLITVSSDLPVGTRVVFSIVFEASPDIQGDPQIINETLILTVTSHRELNFENTLSQIPELNPGEKLMFKVNVTSYSSFTEELELTIPEGEIWSVKCNNLDQSIYTWNLVVPSTNDPAGRTIGWDCELVAPKHTDYIPLELSITSENETLWYTGAELTIASEETEPGGLVFGLIDFEEQIPLMIGVGGLVFLIFVCLMVIAINRRRKSMVEYDEEDEESDVSSHQQHAAQPTVNVPQQQTVQPAVQAAQQQTAQPVMQTPVQAAPITMPQQSTITDEQYRAAGWTEDKIAELRREEANEIAKVSEAIQASQEQAAYAAQVQYQQSQGAAQPLQPSAPEPTSPSQGETQNLHSAFGSLGVTEQPAMEEEQENHLPNTAAALDTLAPVTSVDEIDDGEDKNTDSTEVGETAEQTPEDASDEQKIPQVNCSYCERVLTQSDQWFECPDCGIYSHSQCREGQQVCSRCGSQK